MDGFSIFRSGIQSADQKMNLMNLRNLLIVFSLTSIAFAYPPLTEAEQEKQADAIAWCEVTKITLLEAASYA